jgi:hypothetical protein
MEIVATSTVFTDEVKQSMSTGKACAAIAARSSPARIGRDHQPSRSAHPPLIAISASRLSGRRFATSCTMCASGERLFS